MFSLVKPRYLSYNPRIVPICSESLQSIIKSERTNTVCAVFLSGAGKISQPNRAPSFAYHQETRQPLITSTEFEISESKGLRD